jgi:biotin carboxyl carrier protein
MNNYKVSVNGTEYPVKLLSKDGTRITFELDGKQYTTDISPVFEATANQNLNSSVPSLTVAASSARAGLESGSNLVAPMPGIIIDVRVSEGDSVALGQVLLVMEAMKMENNISAIRAGKVKKIHVSVGQEVKNNQSLISFE